MTFFQHFSGVMNNADNAGEMGSFDAAKLLEALYEQKLIPDAWRPDRDRILADVRRGVLQTSVYRGDHWIHHEIMTVKQPRLHELIVVTRHPNRDTGLSLRLRWWLVHRDGAWRAQEVEYVDFGIRLSLLV